MKYRFFKLVISFAVIISALAECAGGENSMKIYAVIYGKSDFQKKFVFSGDRTGGTVPFNWMLYYIEYGDKKILIDTGFNDPKLVKMFGITEFKDPVIILKDNGISAEQITDVIITHSHFDHIGNAHRFKNAKFIINKDELADLNKGKAMGDVKKFFSKNPNITQFDDSASLYDFFRIKRIGGHTKGSSVVFFKYDNKDYCFTGDEAYLAENVTLNKPNGSTYSLKNNSAFISEMNKSSNKFFIFHDNSFSDMKKRFVKVFPVQ